MKFLQRVKYSREMLDLSEIEMGMKRTSNHDTNKHKSIIMDVFDVV